MFGPQHVDGVQYGQSGCQFHITPLSAAAFLTATDAISKGAFCKRFLTCLTMSYFHRDSKFETCLSHHRVPVHSPGTSLGEVFKRSLTLLTHADTIWLISQSHGYKA